MITTPDVVRRTGSGSHPLFWDAGTPWTPYLWDVAQPVQLLGAGRQGVGPVVEGSCRYAAHDCPRGTAGHRLRACASPYRKI